jgi:hypothetical protein
MLGALILASLPASAQTDPPSACAYLSSLIPVEGGALFLPSYPTAEDGPLRSVAFLYDDAVAAIALVGCGESGRARRIGDAMLAALDHDRAWHDGRLRNAYAAGPVHEFPVKLGGWWDKVQNRWLEDGYQVSSDSGNMAWAMLALLSLDGAQHDPRYRDGAVRIGSWVAGHSDTRGAGGFTGGMSGWEPAPKPVAWKSTEHNTDLAAAFALLSGRTGDPVWSDRARHAAAFVSAMWDEGCACFAVGTAEDGVTPNRILALDAEIWPLIAVPSMASGHGDAVLATVERRLKIGAAIATATRPWDCGPRARRRRRWSPGCLAMATRRRRSPRRLRRSARRMAAISPPAEPLWPPASPTRPIPERNVSITICPISPPPPGRRWPRKASTLSRYPQRSPDCGALSSSHPQHRLSWWHFPHRLPARW